MGNPTRNYRLAVKRYLFVLVFAAIGVFLLLSTRAAAPNISVEPEAGTKTGSVTLVDDPAASGQNAIQFGSADTTTTALTGIENATTVAQVEQALDAFLSRYSMTAQITTITPSSYVKAADTYSILTDADLPNLKVYSELFVQEWSKYPVSFIKFSKVRSLMLVNKLKVSGTARAATPDIVGQAMYYDVQYVYNAEYARGVIHHEFNHLFTYNDFRTYAPNDIAWRSFNTPSFVYGNGGASCYLTVNTCISGEHPINGFVTGYAASAIEEDKAELFAYLMTGSYYHRLKTWIPGDDILNRKVNYYKQYLASRSPEMSVSYFDKINP